MMSLFDDLIKQIAGTDAFVDFNGYASFFGLFQGTVKARILRRTHIRKAQFPGFVSFDGFHKGIRDAYRYIEVGYGLLIGLTGDEFLNIRMIHAQDSHIGTPARAALSDLPKSLIVDAQKTHRTGGLTSRGLHQGSVRAQTRKGKSIAAAGLLDQGGVPQGLKNTGRISAHIIANGENKTGSQLAEGCASTGKSG